MRMRTTIGLSLALLIVSAAAWAKQVHVAHHHPADGIKSKHGKAEAVASRSRAKHPQLASAHVMRHRPTRVANSKVARFVARHHAPHHTAGLPPPDRYIGPLRVVGPIEIGKAAWYGGRHLGERTASGERLDSIHPTAAHRSLPLHSLVKITNLRNGRSVIATINDRGPVSHSLLIDLSPRVAEELDMMRAGIARVTVLPVAAATERRAR